MFLSRACGRTAEEGGPLWLPGESGSSPSALTCFGQCHKAGLGARRGQWDKTSFTSSLHLPWASLTHGSEEVKVHSGLDADLGSFLRTSIF